MPDTIAPFIPVPQKVSLNDPKLDPNTPKIDPKLLSELQQKVNSLEITANLIQKKIEQKKLDSELYDELEKNTKADSNAEIFEEIKKLNDKLTVLEKKNNDIKNDRNEKKNAALTTEDVLAEIEKNEKIENLQNEVRNLLKVFDNIKEIEKTSKNLEKVTDENNAKILNLSERVDEIILESVEVKISSGESPVALGAFGRAIKGIADRHVHVPYLHAYLHYTLHMCYYLYVIFVIYLFCVFFFVFSFLFTTYSWLHFMCSSIFFVFSFFIRFVPYFYFLPYLFFHFLFHQ